MFRTSKVNNITINAVAISSIFNIGDSLQIKPYTRAIAVQREFERFYANEGNFENYSVFTKELPIPFIEENIRINYINENPLICVNSIRIIAISTSSVAQIGSTNSIEAEARVKHIRQLLPKKTSQSNDGGQSP